MYMSLNPYKESSISLTEPQLEPYQSLDEGYPKAWDAPMMTAHSRYGDRYSGRAPAPSLPPVTRQAAAFYPDLVESDLVDATVDATEEFADCYIIEDLPDDVLRFGPDWKDQAGPAQSSQGYYAAPSSEDPASLIFVAPPPSPSPQR